MTNPPEYPLHSLQQLSAVAERRGHDIIDLGMGNPDQRYSFLNLARDALRGNRGWLPALREPTAKSGYEVVVVGGGGHGLATAYYLARKHGVHNVAVLEKAWIGGGIRAGTLRLPARTTSIRSVPRSTNQVVGSSSLSGRHLIKGLGASR